MRAWKGRTKHCFPAFFHFFCFTSLRAFLVFYLKTRVFRDLAVLFITERTMLCLMYFTFFLLCVNTVLLYPSFYNQDTVFFILFYIPLHRYPPLFYLFIVFFFLPLLSCLFSHNPGHLKGGVYEHCASALRCLLAPCHVETSVFAQQVAFVAVLLPVGLALTWLRHSQ